MSNGLLKSRAMRRTCLGDKHAGDGVEEADNGSNWRAGWSEGEFVSECKAGMRGEEGRVEEFALCRPHFTP